MIKVGTGTCTYVVCGYKYARTTWIDMGKLQQPACVCVCGCVPVCVPVFVR